VQPWQTLNSRLLLDRSPWLRVLAEDVQLPDGRVVEAYLRLDTPDYAMVVPVDAGGRVGFIRSYKRGVDAIDMQPPAGMIEPGEDPLAGAQRELFEEMGCRASSWEPLGKYVIGGNMRGGWAHLFLARDCRQVAAPNSGDLEEQEVIWLPESEARGLWAAGELAQMSSAAALGLAFAHLNLPPAAKGYVESI
jgi:ADP-ribose pyrophosphatase